jgi:DNA-binding response OmpR family regulator
MLLTTRSPVPTLIPMTKGTILIIDDERDLVEMVRYNLAEKEGYDVISAGDGQTGLEIAQRHKVDLIVLDLMMPGMDGLEVCRRVRLDFPDLPVLMLTARTDEVDFVVGLDAGADDYVGKPFRLAELLARVRALLRRLTPETVDVGGVRMELSGRRVLVDGAEVNLANKEFELLRVLMLRAGQVVTRDEILREVWHDPDLKTSKTLDMHMSWLRRKIGGEQRIATVRGVGFRFNHD